MPENQLQKLNELLDAEESKGWKLITNVHHSQYMQMLSVELVKRKVPSPNWIRAHVALCFLTLGAWLIIYMIWEAIWHPSKVVAVGSSGDAYCVR